MGFASAADTPVILAADINRGGVIASLVGTHHLLTGSERRRIKGYLINKFRGDKALFDPALPIIKAHTNMLCHGVVPWFEDARNLPAEDAMALDTDITATALSHTLHIAVPRIGRMANFDDLDPLRSEPNVLVSLIQPGAVIPAEANVILLPGSKSTRSDLDALRTQGWDIDIHAHVRRGGVVVGLCGGYQMLGHKVADPLGIEGPPGETPGLGLLDIETILGAAKTLREINVCDPATGAGLLGDKACSVVFDNSKIKELVPGYTATVSFSQGAKECVAWLDADPQRAQIDKEKEAMMDRVITAYEKAWA